MTVVPTLESISGLLVFQIAGIEFCTDLKLITGIKKTAEVKCNSGGLIDTSDNHNYLLIEFSNLFNLKVKKKTESTRVLLLEVYGNAISFFVDKVTAIISLDKIFIENSIDIKPCNNINYVSSVLTIQDCNYYFPDYGEISKEISNSVQMANNFTRGKIIYPSMPITLNFSEKIQD